MNSLERLLVGAVLLVLLLFGGALAVRSYGSAQYRAGYAAAVADGKEARDAAVLANLAIESGLRTRLLEQDTTALRKEQEHATNLEAAQRRMRAGDDRLRCPAGPVPAAAPAGDRPATGGSQADRTGPSIVPETAADLLGIAADVGGLVRRYERVVERFEACLEVNAK
ncbi:hypothetical protein [Massilia alkalitolerans]|uniref:hypothetical protein n=1 Tax=Massilia alkalitolerans TaxID=286638 RepID=UPI0003F56759|nr:hypothetical protein [Massilia alkalitolerans]